MDVDWLQRVTCFGVSLKSQILAFELVFSTTRLPSRFTRVDGKAFHSSYRFSVLNVPNVKNLSVESD
jgi:hypothetical protein